MAETIKYRKNDNGYVGEFVNLPIIVSAETLEEFKSRSIKMFEVVLKHMRAETQFIFMEETDNSDQQSSSLKEEVKRLRGALEELVDLKDMKDTYNKLRYAYTDSTDYRAVLTSNEYGEYLKRKPLAWEAARKLVKK